MYVWMCVSVNVVGAKSVSKCNFTSFVKFWHLLHTTTIDRCCKYLKFIFLRTDLHLNIKINLSSQINLVTNHIRLKLLHNEECSSLSYKQIE